MAAAPFRRTLWLALALTLLAPEAGSKSSSVRRRQDRAAPIDLPPDAPLEDRLKAAILTQDHATVEAILAATDPEPDLAADTVSI